MTEVLDTLMQRLAEGSGMALNIRTVRDQLTEAFEPGKLIPGVNSALRNVLLPDVLAFYLFVDDFYLYPLEAQAALLDGHWRRVWDCDEALNWPASSV